MRRLTMQPVVALVLASAVMLNAAVASGQAREPEPARAMSGQGSSPKGKVIGTMVGAAAGFAFGLVLGLDRFDDAIDSDRKVWTTAVAVAAAGAAGGFFVGGAVSRSQTALTAPALPAPAALPALRLTARPAATVDRHFDELFAPDAPLSGVPAG